MHLLKDKKELYITIFLLVFIIGIRLCLIFYLYPDKERIYNGDSAHYEGLALKFLKNGSYEYPPAGRFSDMIRPPAYPVLIMLTYLIAGIGNFIFLLFWNVAGVVFLFFGIHALFRRLNRQPHFITLLVFSSDLAWILYSKEILTEPIYTPIQLWGIIFLLDGIQKRSLKFLIFSAIFTGISALIKPVSLYFPLIGIVILMINRITWKWSAVYLITLHFCFPKFTTSHFSNQRTPLLKVSIRELIVEISLTKRKTVYYHLLRESFCYNILFFTSRQ